MKLTRLRDARLRRFMTQETLAQKSGVAEGTINRLEAGKTDARLGTINKLAAALGCDPADLVDPADLPGRQ
jgi:transcriptional regulator with XRE-family HTH domain